MSKERGIEIELVSEEADIVNFKVAYTPKELIGKSLPRHVNGIRINSSNYPEYKTVSDTLYLRGDSESRNNEMCEASRKNYNRIIDAVNEFNKAKGYQVNKKEREATKPEDQRVIREVKERLDYLNAKIKKDSAITKEDRAEKRICEAMLKAVKK